MKRAEKLEQLLQLMKENPDLPVLPMVDSEIVADSDYARWVGSWGMSRLARYWVGEEKYYFYDENNIEDVIYDPDCSIELDTMTDEEALAVYKALPWVDCIAVNIDLPDD